MRVAPLMAAGALGFATFAAGAALAVPIGSVCEQGGSSAHSTCVETAGGGSLGHQSFVNSFIGQDSFLTFGSPAQSAGSVGGAGGSSSSIAVTAGPGIIHATLIARSDIEPNSLGAASARVVLRDDLTVTSKTDPAGTPVAARWTVRMDGGFVGNGEAQGEFTATGVRGNGGTVLTSRPSLTLTFDAAYFVGQVVSFRFLVDIRAAAGPGNPVSTADLGHTINIFADALTPGAGLMSAFGHDYSAAAVPEPPPPPSNVPEPGAASLTIIALLGLAAAQRRWAGRSRLGSGPMSG